MRTQVEAICCWEHSFANNIANDGLQDLAICNHLISVPAADIVVALQQRAQASRIVLQQASTSE